MRVTSAGWSRTFRERAVLACTRPHHGLGNRVRAVLGSWVLAGAEGRAFVYTWPTGRSFGSRFDELWQFDEPLIPLTVSRGLSRQYPYRDGSLTWLDERTRTERLWQIRTPHALELPPEYPSWEAALRNLRPTAPVAQAIRAGRAAIPSRQPYVGVMVRTHHVAHPQTLEHSPLEWFAQRMREVRATASDIPFYVAADNPEAFQALSAEFPGVHGTPEKGPYNSARALVASVADLYLLAGSTHILAPHYSSFPELAQMLAGRSVHMETSMSSPDSSMRGTEAATFAPDALVPSERVSVDGAG